MYPASSCTPAIIPPGVSCRFEIRDYVPLARALAVGPWAGVPDSLVRHDCGGIYDERGVVKGEVLVVDWSIVAAFVKLLRAALPNPIQFSIVRAKFRFLSCGVEMCGWCDFSVGVLEQKSYMEGSVHDGHQKSMEQHTYTTATLRVYGYNKSEKGSLLIINKFIIN